MSNIEELQSIEEARLRRMSIVNDLSKVENLDLPYDSTQKFGYQKINSEFVWIFSETRKGRQIYKISLRDLITENLEYIQTLIIKYNL